MSLKETFNKQGGMKLIKGYRKSGALFTATSEFVLLGKSRTALEILRLSTSLKTKKKLSKKFGGLLAEFDKSYDRNLPHEQSDKVWICWFQGIENAPEIVKKCCAELKRNLPSKEIVVITDDNMSDYVQFPDYILEKRKSGVITPAQMSDLLRTELLIRYGGTWIDATVLCTRPESEIPEYFFNSELFFFQSLKPGRDGHSTYPSSWFINAKTNNKILCATRYLHYAYFRKYNEVMDYFLFHYFLTMALEYYSDDWKSIVPRDNATPHILLLRLFDRYDADMWRYITDQTPFHKLTYKFTPEDAKKADTFFTHIIEG